MSIEQDIDMMIQSVMAHTGRRAKSIICSPDAFNYIREKSTLFYTSDLDASNSVCEGRYAGIPLQVSENVEPGKMYVLPEYVSSSSEDTPYVVCRYEDTAWNNIVYRPPYDGPIPAFYGSTGPYSIGGYECIPVQYEETNDIDENSFMDILNCQSP